MKNQFPVIFILLALLACPGAMANSKTDIIKLYNGDRVTGEIKSLYGGILEVSTDSMGTLKIEWPDVASIQSQFHFELRLSNGDRLYGSFEDNIRAGQIALVDIYGNREVESLQVVEMRPIEDTFLERLDLYLATTFSYTRASNLGQVALNTEISYENENSRNVFTGRTDLVDSENKRSQSSRYDITRSTWRTDRGDAYRSVFANYEDNDELGLVRRIGFGAGVGRYFIDTHRSRFTGTAGLQVISERFIGQDTNEDIELFLSSAYSLWQFSSPEVNVDLGFNLYPSLTDSGRVRTDGNLRVRWEIIKDLYWDITSWVTTDNQAENDNSIDYAITTGVGWSY